MNIRNGLVFCSLILFGCGPGVDSTLMDHQLPATAQQSQAVLGKGYDNKEERFAGDCVRGNVQYVGSQQASIKFERSLSEREMSDSLGFSAGGKARYGLYKASAAASFSKSSSSDSYSESTVYESVYKYKNAKLDFTSYTPIGQAARGGEGAYVWDRWTKTCGHEFVEQIELGAKLLVSAKVEFSSKEDKMAFNANFSIKGPAFSARGALRKASKRFGKSAAVYIRAFQLGGDVRQLSRIFGNVTREEDTGATQAVLECSMEKIDKCLEVLSSAIEYATDLESKHSFPNQIDPSWDPSSPGGPAELAYITKPWSDLAIYAPPAVIENMVRTTRSSVESLFNRQLIFRGRIDGLLTGPFRLTPQQQNKIQQANEDSSKNLDAIFNSAMVCYNQVENCVSSYEDLVQKIVPIEDESLAVFPQSFAQWCDLKDSGSINEQKSKLIEILFHRALEGINPSTLSDPCFSAEEKLRSLTRLSLDGKKIKDINILKSLPALEVLNLNRNNIEDIGVLAQLPNLQEVYLNDNKIKSLAPLRLHQSLRVLGASYNYINVLPVMDAPELKVLKLNANGIKQIPTLIGLVNLHTLELSENRIESVEPLLSAMELRFIDLSYNFISDFSQLSSLPRLQQVVVTSNHGSCPSVLLTKCSAIIGM
ncbi:MAG: hypothetical protein CMP10_04330 [Zetaproteobacteria bacterium]|nr:hypothetical protein [Pseudobdellovibrionaceae bacterium]